MSDVTTNIAAPHGAVEIAGLVEDKTLRIETVLVGIRPRKVVEIGEFPFGIQLE